ncbi:unnamed protein product [Clavelina lepadiformis]|uniref:G-protein coupled receptors family 1 profile domain-containing protein n=1 Tax=Clavelina lepadiformis TaxID=159417 RepID=A0ABP0GCI0_CLALP
MSNPSKNMLPQAQSQAQRRCRKSRTFKNCGTLKALRYLHIESKLIIIFAALVMDSFSFVLAQGEIADLLMDNSTTAQTTVREANKIVSEVKNSTDGSMTIPAGNISSIGLYLIIGAVSFFTVVGNLLVIMSVLVFHKLRKVRNMFIVSLALADLIMGGVVLPMGAHSAVTSQWILGKFGCHIWTSVDVLSVTASICTLCAISLDRFVAITMPFKYSRKMTRVRAAFVISFIWIISAAISFIPINMGWWKTTDSEDERYERGESCDFHVSKTYAVVSSCISFYIPLIVMVIAYSIVFKIAIQKREKIRNRRGMYKKPSTIGVRNFVWGSGEYRAVFTMGIIMGTFCACWLPFFIVNIVTAYCGDCIDPTAFTVLNWLGYSNSLFNPIIYCHSKEFREAFKRLLLCGICREGFDEMSMSSLSVSYTPTASGRASIRSENSFPFLINMFSSDSRRLSGKTSNVGITNNAEYYSNGYLSSRRSSLCNGGIRRTSYSSEGGKLLYGRRGSGIDSCSINSAKSTDSDESNQLLPRLDEAAETESACGVEMDNLQETDAPSASQTSPSTHSF